MSDTLRTDTLLIIHDMDPEPKVLINHARALERALNNADARIKRLEEELMEVKNKHSVLVADVALDEDRADRIHRLEDRIHRAAMAFFRDGSDGHVASQMLQILEEERGKK